MINEKKICFISCVNDEMQYKECLKYIMSLNIPKDYSIDTMQVEDAKSMAAGYNEAMKQSDAKYKVYLHQDTFIINKNFIYDIISIFNADKEIGMIGCAGAKYIPKSGIWWESSCNVGKIYDSHTGKMELIEFKDQSSKNETVEAIDGAIMITQYDVEWREDIFNGWHFYDISQSVDFNIKGFKVIIPNQKEPWCIHDCGIVNVKNGFEKYRNLFLREYMKSSKTEFFDFGIDSKIEDGFEVFCPQGISIGNKVSILKDACFMLPYNNFKGKPLIIIEDECSLGRRIMISAVNKIHIGKRCIFASNVHITDHNHEYHNVGVPIMYQGIDSFDNEVNIGEGSWIANNCVIVGNVNIGKGCTIGANSLVNSDIPDYCVAVGSPARVIKAFDFLSNKWVKVDNNEGLIEILKNRNHN